MMEIILVDDHDLIREGIKELISNIDGFQVVGQAENGQIALEMIDRLKPHLVIMDVDMPVMNGLEASIRIKRAHPTLKVLIITMHGEPALIKRMMDIGADGFLLKNSDREEFSMALNRLKSGKTFFSQAATEIVISGKASATGQFALNVQGMALSTLSEREIEILRWIAQGKSNREIGEQLFISHRTVDSHRTNIMKKLDIHHTAGLVKIAIENGLLVK